MHLIVLFFLAYFTFSVQGNNFFASSWLKQAQTEIFISWCWYPFVCVSDFLKMLNWLCAKIITLVLWLPVYVEQITWGMSFRWVKKINIFRIVIYQPVTLRTLSSQEASFLDCEVFSCSVSLKCSCIRSLQVQTIASGCFYPSRSLCLIFIKFVKSHTLRQQAKIALSLFLELKFTQEFEKCAKSWSQARRKCSGA